MQNRFIRHTTVFVAVLIGISLCLVDAGAQTRRKRRPRRVSRPVITNPAITPSTTEQTPAAGEKIISTADETPGESEETVETTKPKKAKPASRQATDDETMQQTINSLSNQVNKLTDKLSQMQENDRSALDMERLTRAEQRAESLRSQQFDVESKLADLQSKLDQIEYAIKPENIERAQATFGSTRPEEARDARRRQLESERARVQAQMKILENSRARLEVAVNTADAEVDLLRRRLESHRQPEESVTSPRSEPRPSNDRQRPQ